MYSNILHTWAPTHKEVSILHIAASLTCAYWHQSLDCIYQDARKSHFYLYLSLTHTHSHTATHKELCVLHTCTHNMKTPANTHPRYCCGRSPPVLPRTPLTYPAPVAERLHSALPSGHSHLHDVIGRSSWRQRKHFCNKWSRLLHMYRNTFEYDASMKTLQKSVKRTSMLGSLKKGHMQQTGVVNNSNFFILQTSLTWNINKIQGKEKNPHYKQISSSSTTARSRALREVLSIRGGCSEARVSLCPGTTWGMQGQASCCQNHKAVSKPRRCCFICGTVVIKWWHRCPGVK